MKNFLFLIAAIVSETFATSMLKESDMPAILGMVLIVAGVVVINLFSKMQVH